MPQTIEFNDAVEASPPSDAILDAVNEILASIGEPPAEALDTGGTSEIAEAEDYLNRESRLIQAEGWYVNSLWEKVYEPDGDDLIALPNVLKLTAAGTDHWRRLSNRNGQLYDLDEKTNEFAADVTLDVVVLLAFADLPQHLRNYIVKSASLKFQRYKKRGQIDEAILQQELSLARVRAIQEDTDGREVNVLSTDAIVRLKGNRQVYR
jgi:hypothetical protein